MPLMVTLCLFPNAVIVEAVSLGREAFVVMTANLTMALSMFSSAVTVIVLEINSSDFRIRANSFFSTSIELTV